MKGFFEKLDKRIVAGVAGLIAILNFVNGILNIVDSKEFGVGAFINSLMFVAAMGLLIYFILKDKKQQGIIIVIVIIGGAVLANFGNGINYFINAGDDAGYVSQYSQLMTAEDVRSLRTEAAGLVFAGLASIAFFVGVLSHISLKITNKLPEGVVKTVGMYSYLVAGAAAFLAFILIVCVTTGTGQRIAIMAISMISMLAEAFLLMTLLNQEM